MVEEQKRKIDSLKGKIAELPGSEVEMPAAIKKFTDRERAALEEKIRSEESAPILPWGEQTGKKRKESPGRIKVQGDARAEASKAREITERAAAEAQEKERVLETELAYVEGLFDTFAPFEKTSL